MTRPTPGVAVVLQWGYSVVAVVLQKCYSEAAVGLHTRHVHRHNEQDRPVRARREFRIHLQGPQEVMRARGCGERRQATTVTLQTTVYTAWLFH
jgi:hypothetical protein